MSQKMKEQGKEWKECQRQEHKGSMVERMIESKREREILSKWKEIYGGVRENGLHFSYLRQSI